MIKIVQPNSVISKIFLLLLTVSLVSCNSKNNPDDPMESYNRKVYAFNQFLNRIIIRPTASAYDKITPSPIRRGVSNAFSNIRQPTIFINDILQGEFKHAGIDLWRFIINSTLGVGGLFDVATHWSMKKHDTDFGITLAKWGNKKSPYFVLPVLGPSTLRDTFGFTVESTVLTAYPYIRPVDIRNIIVGARYLDFRANLLEAEDVISEAALDRYSFERDSFLQRRAALQTESQESVDPFVEGQ